MKRVTEAALAPFATLLARRRIGTRETLVLAYHNIVPDGSNACGEVSLHLARAMFRAQLDLLATTHDVISLAEVRDRPIGKRPRAVITFDDGYRGAMTAGLEELSRRKMPATFFIAPEFVPDRSFWWDDAAAAGGGLAEEQRRHAIEDCAGRDPIARKAIGVPAAPEMPPHARAIDEAGLLAASAVPGITFGSHTWSHVNLARVTGSDALDELTRPQRWLRERFPNTINWLSFPYGRNSPESGELAASCGYDGALRIDGGWVHSHRRTDFILPRMNVPSGVSVRGFRLRAAGMLVS